MAKKSVLSLGQESLQVLKILKIKNLNLKGKGISECHFETIAVVCPGLIFSISI